MTEYNLSYSSIVPHIDGLEKIEASDILEAINKQWPNSRHNGHLTGPRSWVGTVTMEDGQALAVAAFWGSPTQYAWGVD